MIPARSRFFVSSLMFVLLMVCLSISSWAEEPCESWAGKIVSVQGSVEARRVSETHWDPVHLNDTYCIGDMIRVQKHSRAALVLSNGATLRLDQESTITFTRVEEKQTLLLKLLKGAAHFFSRIPHTLKLATPFVNGGVEGTEFFVRVDENKTFISIFEGKVLASNAVGSLVLTSGQSAIAEAGKAPVSHVVVRPRDAVQWALYYPPVIYGKIPAEEDTNDPRFLIYQASMLLSVGRVDEAKFNIEQALKADPKYGDAIALQSIIAVVQNEKGKALDLAQQAVETDPKSATARIGLSYAQQANFDLQGALNSLKESVRLSPENALAWARLAELWSSFGELDKALDAAQKAVALDPNLSRTQSVLGFAYLTQVKTKESKKAFEKAIELDQAAPFPRLGLGLAKIREGDLQDGGREVEIAASLDPNNSLVRSYLGKVYYEEKRTKLDGREYAIAKELDPQDPTPWFYDAIRLQTVNRPVEALNNLQKAIELNDNRAVYRSKLLLDSDLAARSSSLARIYNNLGFQQLGLVEGWKSVNTDPSNFSAHRFLADSYAALPRHEIARTSELLQSQLLQPINLTPLQPQLAESNLAILAGTGPSDPSFNEFNPLFQRNRVALQADVVVGGNDTLGEDLVFSGIYGKGSFSFGQFHYETVGFRENNDQERNVYNIFAQLNPWYKTSILAEFRETDSKFGDLPLRFDPQLFYTDDRNMEKAKSIRLGARHSFSPQSDLIATVVFKDAEAKLENLLYDFEIKSEEDGYMAEAQHLFRSERVSIVSGLSFFRSDRKDTATFSPMPPESFEDVIRFTNLYLYSQISIPKNVTWILGASADFFKGILDKNRFNPKVGITWNPISSTTLRAAAFRVLSKSMISDQTIEPTQVAGFNQFFNDFEADEAWRYGVAIDHKFRKNLFGGLELSRRDIDTPYISSTFEVEETKWKEKLGRAYLYWTPYDWLAANAEYQWERFERDLESTGEELIHILETHKLPLGVNIYSPMGITIKLKATYVDQEGEFDVNPGSFVTESGSEHFWVVDASISYRLPNRYGLLSIEGRNLFDEQFQFQSMDKASPEIATECLILVKITLSF
jgi:tetratricopeptide (TPR) repeat protein